MSQACGKKRNTIIFAKFVKIKKERIESAKILGLFSFAVPTKTRSRPVLYVPAARVDTVRNGMFCRLPRCVNQLCEKVPAADLYGSKMITSGAEGRVSSTENKGKS